MTLNDRRRFLRLLAGSPLFVYSGLHYTFLEGMAASESVETKGALGLLERILQNEGVIESPDRAVNVMDFEAVAREKLPPAHYGYLATGVDDDATLRANREGFRHFEIRSRRLVDVSSIDMSVRLFDTVWDTPIVLAPAGSQNAFHPEGEIAVARAAGSKSQLQILSTVTTHSVEDVIAARGAPVWYQLYPTDDRLVERALVKRAEAAGCPVLVLTVDLHDWSNRETEKRLSRLDTRPCGSCHSGGFSGYVERKPMYDGLDMSRATELYPSDMTWDAVKRLKDLTTMKFVLKGIVTREDSRLAVKHGADGIIVSNHGGRSEGTDRATIDSLPEVVDGVAGKIPVLVDGGFRRGTDIFKALALGADAVCIARPYLWGLAAFGQPGVETVIDILKRELQIIMRQAGTTSVGMITPAHIVGGSR